MQRAIYLLILCIFCVPCDAMSGKELMALLSDGKKHSDKKPLPAGVWMGRGVFVGFLDGVASTLINLNLICLPDNAAKGDASELVKHYLARHPEQASRDAGEMVKDVLISAWPCNK